MGNIKKIFDREKVYFKKKYISLILLILLFLIISYSIGPTETNDTYSYVNGYRTRTVLYPLMIKLFGFNMLILIQNILGSIGVYLVAEFFISKIKDNFINRLAIYFFALMPWIYYVVGEREWLTNVIMTEGLIYPLFYIFVYLGMSYWDKESIKKIYLMIFLQTVMVFIRVPMIYLCVFPVFLVFLKKIKVKQVIFIVLLSVACIALIVPAKSCYYHIFPYIDDELTHYDYGIMENFIGISNGDLNTKNVDELFFYKEIYSDIEEKGYTFEQFKKKYGLEVSYRYSESNDYISYMIIQPKADELVAYFSQKNNISTIDAVKYVRELANKVESKVLIQNWNVYLEMYIARVLEGTFRIVSAGVQYGWLIAIILYASLIAMIIYNKNHKIKFYELFLALICVLNIVEVCIFIFPADRYVIYGMGFFYIFMWIEFTTVISKIKRELYIH